MRWLVLLLLATPLLAAPGYAAPPPGADGSLAPWFQSLSAPGSNASCCSIADCRNVQAEIRGDGHWWAWVDSRTFPDRAPNAWIMVPDDVILKRHDNPSGEKRWLCWYAGSVRCFVEGSGT